MAAKIAKFITRPINPIIMKYGRKFKIAFDDRSVIIYYFSAPPRAANFLVCEFLILVDDWELAKK